MKNIISRLSKLLFITLVTANCIANAGTDVPTSIKMRANMDSIVFGNKNNQNKSRTPWSFIVTCATVTTVVLYKTCQKIYPGLSLRKFFEQKKSVDKSSIIEDDSEYLKRHLNFIREEARRDAKKPKPINNKLNNKYRQ